MILAKVKEKSLNFKKREKMEKSWTFTGESGLPRVKLVMLYGFGSNKVWCMLLGSVVISDETHKGYIHYTYTHTDCNVTCLTGDNNNGCLSSSLLLLNIYSV